MYERPPVNVKVERGSTFTFTRDLPNIASTLFTRVNKIYVRNACKNYATVEIHLESDSIWTLPRFFQLLKWTSLEKSVDTIGKGALK